MRVRLFKIIFFLLVSVKLFAQHPVFPTTTPTPFNSFYYQFNRTGAVGVGTLMLGERADTNIAPIYPAICVLRTGDDRTVYFWDTHKWSNFAPGTVTLQQLIDSLSHYVKYTDSINVYVTPTQLNDSFVHIYKYDEVKSRKQWDSTQTFNGDSTLFNGTIYQSMTGKQINNHFKVDSLQYIYNSTASSNRMFTQINDPTYSYHTQNDLPYTTVNVQQIRLDDHNDTLSSLASNQGAFGSKIQFKNITNSSAPTYYITNDKTNAWTAGSFGASILVDSALIADGTKTWNIDMPLSGVTSFIAVPKHGTTYSYDDLDVGTMTLLDSVGTDYTLTTRHGLRIRSLANSHLSHPYGIYQEGLNDTLFYNSKVIQTPSIGSALTGAWDLLMDANGNWVKKTYIPKVIATLDFPSTAAQSSSELTVSVTGASVNMVATVSSKVNPDNTCWTAYVSSANVVTIRFNNYSSGSVNPASNDFIIKVFPD